MSHDFLTIRGNHDRQLIDRSFEQMGSADRAAYAQLDDRHRAWLAGLPATAVMDDVFLCHGSPESDLTYLLEHVGPEGASLAPPEQVRDLTRDISQPVVLCGHTHLQRAVTVQDGPLVINPGSVGLQGFYDDVPFPHVIQAGSPHARYAMVERRAGHWRVEFLVVEYDGMPPQRSLRNLQVRGLTRSLLVTRSLRNTSATRSRPISCEMQ